MIDLNFSKYPDGLIPAIVQDADTRVVLMLGFMNQEAFDITLETHKVTFFSRSRQTLWTKGETSGNFLNFVEAKVDCDNDTLLIKAHPMGPTCHLGTDTCWAEENKPMPSKLELVQQRQNYSNVSENLLNMQKTIASMQQIIDKGESQQTVVKKECTDLLKNLLQVLSAHNINIDEIEKNL